MPLTLPDHLTPTVRAALADAAAALRALYGERLRHLVLFGSQARGDAREASDIDLLVVLDGEVDSYAESEPLAYMTGRLFDKHGLWVTFLPLRDAAYQDAHHPLMRNVHEEGIEL